MESSDIRTEIIKEVNLVPEEKLIELYNFIHYFRLGVEDKIETVLSRTGLTQLAQAMVREAHRAHQKLHRRHRNVWAF